MSSDATLKTRALGPCVVLMEGERPRRPVLGVDRLSGSTLDERKDRLVLDRVDRPSRSVLPCCPVLDPEDRPSGSTGGCSSGTSPSFPSDLGTVPFRPMARWKGTAGWIVGMETPMPKKQFVGWGGFVDSRLVPPI